MRPRSEPHALLPVLMLLHCCFAVRLFFAVRASAVTIIVLISELRAKVEARGIKHSRALDARQRVRKIVATEYSCAVQNCDTQALLLRHHRCYGDDQKHHEELRGKKYSPTASQQYDNDDSQIQVSIHIRLFFLVVLLLEVVVEDFNDSPSRDGPNETVPSTHLPAYSRSE